MEEALDCFAAVTTLAGAAEEWERGRLSAGHAARILEQRRTYINPLTGDVMPGYRKAAREAFHVFAHCTAKLTYWNVLLEKAADGSVKGAFSDEDAVNVHAGYVIDTYLLTHCAELLQVIRTGYPTHFEPRKESEEVDKLMEQLESVLVERMQAGLTGAHLPEELEERVAACAECTQDSQVSFEGKWTGEWTCSGSEEPQRGRLELKQKGTVLRGDLRTRSQVSGKELAIREKLIGVIEGRRVLLDGHSTTVVPALDGLEYKADTFHLLVVEEGLALEGTHSCSVGEGKARFVKT